MADEENKGEFKVSDKRRFVVAENGKVKMRPEGEKAGGKKAEAKAAAADDQVKQEGQAEERAAGEGKGGEEIDQDTCECEEDYAKLPPIDFISFLFSLSTSTMIFLGILPDPTTTENRKNLILAKQHIDLLGMLKEKTANNLTKEEEQFLNSALYDLRVKFVEVCQKK